MQHYDIRLFGFAPGGRETPEAALQRLFGMEPQAATRLLQSLPRVVKHNVGAAQAQRIEALLRGVGARLSLEPAQIRPGHAVFVGGAQEVLPDVRSNPPPAASATARTLVASAPPPRPRRSSTAETLVGTAADLGVRDQRAVPPPPADRSAIGTASTLVAAGEGETRPRTAALERKVGAAAVLGTASTLVAGGDDVRTAAIPARAYAGEAGRPPLGTSDTVVAGGDGMAQLATASTVVDGSEVATAEVRDGPGDGWDSPAWQPRDAHATQRLGGENADVFIPTAAQPSDASDESAAFIPTAAQPSDASDESAAFIPAPLVFGAGELLTTAEQHHADMGRMRAFGKLGHPGLRVSEPSPVPSAERTGISVPGVAIDVPPVTDDPMEFVATGGHAVDEQTAGLSLDLEGDDDGRPTEEDPLSLPSSAPPIPRPPPPRRLRREARATASRVRARAPQARAFAVLAALGVLLWVLYLIAS